MFAGLTAGATRAHLVRAALDALCFRVRDVVDAMAATAGRPAALRVDGGLTANGYLLQRQADVLGIPVVVARTPETTALGAAALAGVGAGALTLDDVAAAVGGGRTVEPQRDATDEYEAWRAFARASGGADAHLAGLTSSRLEVVRCAATTGGSVTDHLTPSRRITDEVTSWPGVEAGYGSRGEYAFRLGRREIGHLHGDRARTSRSRSRSGAS